MNVIEVKELVKKFGNKKVINEISFNVHEGEIFGFLGPSGAGKTTLIKMLIGEYSITGGEALVFGEVPNKLNETITNKISALMDNFGLYEQPIYSTLGQIDMNDLLFMKIWKFLLIFMVLTKVK